MFTRRGMRKVQGDVNSSLAHASCLLRIIWLGKREASVGPADACCPGWRRKLRIAIECAHSPGPVVPPPTGFLAATAMPRQGIGTAVSVMSKRGTNMSMPHGLLAS